LFLPRKFPAMTSSGVSPENIQGDRFLRFVDGLVAEHQALQIQVNRLNLENTELHQRLRRENGTSPELYLSPQPEAPVGFPPWRTPSQHTSSFQSSLTASDVQLPNPPVPPPVQFSQQSETLASGIHRETINGQLKQLTKQGKSPTGQLLQPVPSPNFANHHDSTGSISCFKDPSDMLDTHLAAPKAMEIAGAEADLMDDNLFGEGTLISTSAGNEKSKSSTARVMAVNRLRERLEHLDDSGIVTPDVLWDTLNSLGLTKYSYDDVHALMIALKNMRACSEGIEQPQSASWTIGKMGLSSSTIKAHASHGQNCQVRCDHMLSQTGVAGASPDEACSFDCGMAFDEFAACVIDESVANLLEFENRQTLSTVREVLLAAEANRLVAELTNVEIDDLASSPPPPELISHLEPWVNLAIFINGILVGVQTDMYDSQWKGWMPIEIGFTSFFVGELAIRLKVVGFRKHFFGTDWGWNYFDIAIIAISLINLFMELLSATTTKGPGLTILRLVRLTRLSRMLRMLRFSYLKELALMIKGLLGGFKTLVWACVLLIFAIYLIAVFITAIVAPDPVMKKDDYSTWKMFNGVAQSMFTGFRCFTGDCTDEAGNSLVLILTNKLGWPFSAGYVICSMMITFGIFNLIIAIYIENTLEAAKLVTTMDKKARDREALRVAHLTKKLLKKFCRAKHRLSERSLKTSDAQHLNKVLGELHADDDDEVIDFDMVISRDLFLYVIQNPSVQSLFDQLEIPADRAHLFDVLDADGSGGLQVTELVQGLLRVRGDPRKVDIVATLLSVRAMQVMLRRVQDKILTNEDKILTCEKKILTHEKQMCSMMSTRMLVPVVTDRRLEDDCKLLS